MKLWKELFRLLLTNYQEVFENKMEGSIFVFEYVDELSYLYHKISLNYGGSYINFPYKIKNKKAKMNTLKKYDDKYFQYFAIISLNHTEIGENLQS